MPNLDPFELLESVDLTSTEPGLTDRAAWDPIARDALALVVAIALLVSYEGSSEAIRSIGEQFRESIREAVGDG